ncbi:DUF3316 domain-containing protein [Vibrio pacinii]|uniref:DUF3316 domain-containing protein n=1 Tax=Vibrio pacinii TaxID=170674 RepID=UPI00056E6CED|nr:DUF3316 domain-containing protein [Vibrio pacinii]
MKKLILFATLVISASVFAANQTVISHSTLTTDAYATKQQAYDAAFDLMDEMKAMDSAKLKIVLPIHENNVISPSVKVNDMLVQVEEYAKAPGQFEYKAKLGVDYQYTYRESRRD